MDFEEDELKEEEEYDNASSLSKEEENFSSATPTPTDEEILGAEEPNIKEESLPEKTIQNARGIASKKVIGLLFKKYGVLIALGALFIGFLLIVIILNLQGDFDLYGAGNITTEYYTQAPGCGKVYLTWENESYTKTHEKDADYEPITDPLLVDLTNTERFTYEEYDYDTFITGVVWTDNDKAKDIDNEVVYQAMVVAARSRLLAELPNNCVVLRDYNEQGQSFTKLTGTEKKYTEISQAVVATRGLLIGKSGQALKAIYEPFSYTKKMFEEDETKNDVYYYHMAHRNNEETQRIYAKWVDDLEKEKGEKIPKLKVDEVKVMTSMSLYGAKYYIEKINVEYDLYRILRYYYGQDIEFYTIDYAFSNDYQYDINLGCSPISMNKTTLSREEFILLAQKYGTMKAKAKALAEHAGLIYDIATSNNMNPELVFVRADVEGYSPGVNYNYWGIGCTNTGGLAACKSYASISEGVSAFLKTISNYTSLNDFYKYAFLGRYWYNPGSWGLGGCPYASSIYGENIPERVINACAKDKYCPAEGGYDCVATTEEEQQLYANFQSRTMISARKKIFGLDADTCETQGTLGEPGKGSCTIWKQSDSRWGNIKLGSSSTNMKESGCAVTSIAIAISCSGVEINNVAGFNPGVLVERLNREGGFKGGSIYWNNVAIKYFAPSFQYGGNINLTGSATDKINTVISNNTGHMSILLHFVNERHSSGHWVVFKSASGETFTVYDPAYGKINTYHASEADRMIIYRY